MSRGLGRVERVILDDLEQRREPLLADRWHPLLVEPLDGGPSLLVGPGAAVGQAVIGAITGIVPHLFFGGHLDEGEWETITNRASKALGEIHTGPFFVDSLMEVCTWRDESSNPYAVEVSALRAAKRLEDKGLIERCYVSGETRWQVHRSFVCVRISPSRDELADTGELRGQAKQVHTRYLHDSIKWIRKWGQAAVTVRGQDERQVPGYYRAARAWIEDGGNRSADWKWLKWFDGLNDSAGQRRAMTVRDRRT